MTEPVLVLKWLKSVLTTDSELTDPDNGVAGGWHRIAPAGVKSPYGIVRQFGGAEDLTGLNDGQEGGTPIWVPVVMQVTLYDRERSDYGRIDPLAARVYALLQRATATLSEGIIYGSRRSYINAGEDVHDDAVEIFIEQRYTTEARSEIM